VQNAKRTQKELKSKKSAEAEVCFEYESGMRVIDAVGTDKGQPKSFMQLDVCDSGWLADRQTIPNLKI
jgi:hypothetical protein